MAKKKYKIPNPGAHIDYVALGCIIALIAIGVVMVYSASYVTAEFRTNDANSVINRERFFVIVGAMLMIFTTKLSYRWFRVYRHSLTWALVGFTFLTFALLYTPLGKTVNGALRWLDFGFLSFQPSELAKYTCIFLVAMLITTKGNDVEKIPDLAKMAIIPIIFTLLVLMQPDMTTSIIILVIAFYLFYIAGMKTWIILASGLLGVGSIVLAIAAAPYRLERVRMLFDPLSDPLGSGYQVLQSLYAIASGGLTGVGLGNSNQKLLYLPEPHNDYIFSIVAEELGFIGALIVIILFVTLVIRIFKIAANAPDKYSALIVSGIGFMIASQVLINIGVSVSLFPSTGIPLPFISYGGTSLVLLMIGMGFVLNISRYDKRYLVTQDKEKFQEIRRRERLN